MAAKWHSSAVWFEISLFNALRDYWHVCAINWKEEKSLLFRSRYRFVVWKNGAIVYYSKPGERDALNVVPEKKCRVTRTLPMLLFV